MQTATALVLNPEKNSVTTDVQVIFDSGSQRAYVNEELCRRIKLPVIRSQRIILKTFANNKFQARGANVVLIKFCTVLYVFVEAICSPVICADLSNENCNFVSKWYSHLQSLNLPDKSTDGSKAMDRSSPPELFLGKGVLKICSKFTGEHPCRSAISVKLLCVRL